MVEIKHIQQQNDGCNWKCGVVCLEMIFDYYKIPCKQDDVWNAVKTNRNGSKIQKFALTHSLAKYSIHRCLNATVYKADADTWPDVLDKLERLSIPAILSVKYKNTNFAHFIIYLGRKDGNYYFDDPDLAKAPVRYDYSQVREKWSPHGKEVTGFVYIIFEGDTTMHTCIHCNQEYPVLVRGKAPFSNVTICPYCDGLNHAE